ncbi:MAG TPA: DEAD/DEAH box helicase, partial [Polyangiaceae bacterium]|nr:DEAD/DEAH box helicase [Polyangiaceae bacterium]
NPAVEDQATDRAYRIGQDKPVTVVRLMARGTIEEKILALKAKKRDLARAVIDDDAGALRGLTDEDLRTLLGGVDGEV